MQRRRRSDGEAWIALELRVPQWALWCVAGGVLLLVASNTAAVVVLLSVAR